MKLIAFSALLFALACTQVGAQCVEDPCDWCNSEQVCSNGQCQTGGDTACEGVTCGANAVCKQGTCHCRPGYEGDPTTGCAVVTTTTQATTPPPPTPTPEPTPESTPAPTPTPTPTPTQGPTGTVEPGTSPVQELLSEKDWDVLFPHRWYVSHEWKKEYLSSWPWFYPEMNVDYYSYRNFVEAVKTMTESGFGNFLNEPGSTIEDRKRELCAFLGNAGHETGRGTDGLFYREELGYERTYGNWDGGYRSVGSRTDYRMGNTPVPFRPGTQLAGQVRFRSASYHGRGPLQLSWGYNYGDYSKAVFGDPQVLLENPDRLLDEPKLGISAAIWFWMTQPDWRMTHNPHKNMYKHTAPMQPWGFGRTIMAINGGLEGNSNENGPTEKDKKVTRRIKNYRRCAQHFGIPVGVNGEQLDTAGLFN